MINKIKVLIFIPFIIFFCPVDLLSKSSDSPNLKVKIKKTHSWDEWIEITKKKLRKKK